MSRKFLKDKKNIKRRLLVNTGAGHGSTNTKIRRFATVVVNTNNSVTFVDSADSASEFIVNDGGIYAISYHDMSTAVSINMGISINSTQLTTNIGAIDPSARYAYLNNAANNLTQANYIGYISANSTIRAHTAGSVTSTGTFVSFEIEKIG